jgi:hypothetical protein
VICKSGNLFNPNLSSSICAAVTRKIHCTQKLISQALSTRFHPSSPAAKNIPLGVSGKSAASFRTSRLIEEGRIAIVTNVEAGSGGRETSQHSFLNADERCFADGQAVWS